MKILYVTHPQVVIDPNVPVAQWGLSEVGRVRALALAAWDYFSADTIFISSTETKAMELAHILARSKNSKVIADAALGENDRTATGFLPPDKFEDMADRFFANPNDSVEGWERAIDAQARVVEAVSRLAATHTSAPAMVFCGHGAVGSLLKCYVADRAISRAEDQPGGGGNIFQFELAPKKLICEWTPMDDWMGFET